MARQAKRSSKQSGRGNALNVIHPNAAGIDLGSSRHYVAVPPERDPQPVRSFECFTADLYRMADWLASCGIKTVAMEATGVYWVPVYQVLETRGFEVKLVNPRHLKNVPGRKSDVQDCQWIQRLHAYGLLTASFRPEDEVCVLRSYVRQRATLVEQSSTHVQRMQKALVQMNLQLHKVLRDITGLTGMRIIEAIVAGERDPLVLAQMRDPRVHSTAERIAAALQGDYRTEHLFVLRQELALYKFIREQISQCEERICACVGEFPDQSDGQPPPKRERKNKRHPELRDELFRMTGVDLTAIDGIDALTAQTVISEIGLDMTRWPNAKAFCAWITLAPRPKITGGKVQSSATQPSQNRAAAALRRAAWALSNSQSALGAYYRRLRARLGSPKAITATAHKLARIVYNLLKHGHAYVDPGLKAYETQYRDRMIRNLSRRAQELGFGLRLLQPDEHTHASC